MTMVMTIGNNDSDDDDNDDGDDWSGLAHAACASDDDDDGDDPIRVASPMKMICFSSDPIGVSFCSFSIEGRAGSDVQERERKSRLEVRGERKPNKKQYFGLPHLSVSLQICNGMDTNGIILAHMQHLMGVVFCVWCGICAKYLAFGTYPTSTMGALR